MQRQLNEIGHDYVSIGIYLNDVNPDSLWVHAVERNTTIYDGKPWTSTQSVPLQFARIGQNQLMNLFAEHVAEYARISEGL